MNKGVIMALMSALAFSVLNVFVKELSFSMSVGEIAFFRGLFSTVILVFLMRAQKVHLSHRNIPTLIFRGVLGGIGMICLFYAISGMPLGDVSILSQLSAFFVVIFATIFLHDVLPRKAIAPLVIIVCGACLILHPWNYGTFNSFALFALAQSVIVAVVYTTISKLTNEYGHHQYEVVLYFLVCATISGAVLMGTDYVNPVGVQWLMIIGMGIITVVAQVWMTNAYAWGDPIIVSFVQYAGVFFNALWGYLVFGEILSALSIVGGLSIIGGSMYLSHLKHQRVKNMSTVRERT
jgi:drug/metabolite transporter (DMT)-like permease